MEAKSYTQDEIEHIIRTIPRREFREYVRHKLKTTKFEDLVKDTTTKVAGLTFKEICSL